ncbi:hypothetical protein FHS61_001385 [Altererythrobacter atlanticus]|uniref:Uncharacterized protein n=1 Tax=Croceibacterium atlanticum TaxID=1267766 RepID=A0A0F7KXX3_9SPHN|nr:cytochrome c [Croceibacterium atlanticum]AKH44067.1 hypothetical protein WYH_03047 [Croceibacterium atlanticum]MBB5732376.1 hypothetical protein [Croceibacterium atlanticum]
MKKLAQCAAIISVLSLAACQDTTEPVAESTPSPRSDLTLPVSINAVMVGLIDNSADYIWAVGNGDMPKDDNDWDLVRSATYDMILGGTVSKIPGTGEFDAQWTAEENWQEMADELTKIGQDALPLAEAKSTDVEAWRQIGDRLIQNCESCHEAFKPEIPSEGILHRSTESESRGESIFD